MFRRRWRLSKLDVRAGQAPGTSDRVFRQVGMSFPAAEHAAIRSLGDRKFFRSPGRPANRSMAFTRDSQVNSETSIFVFAVRPGEGTA